MIEQKKFFFESLELKTERELLIGTICSSEYNCCMLKTGKHSLKSPSVRLDHAAWQINVEFGCRLQARNSVIQRYTGKTELFVHVLRT